MFILPSMPPHTAPTLRAASATLALIVLIFGSSGCSPAGRSGTTGEVVEIETIEVLEPAGGQVALQPKTGAIDAEAALSKKTVDDATAAADRAIAEAGKTIPGKADEPPMKKPAAAAVTTPPAAAPAAAVDAAVPAASTAPRERVLLGEPSLTSGVPGTGPITLAEVDQWLRDPRQSMEIEPVLPLGLSQAAAQITGLDKNPLTRAKIELGRQLYFDPRLSVDSTVSCASCHNPAEGYSAHTKTGVGIRGQQGNRNSPASFNRILSGPQFWDGRAESLEAQAVGPIANPIEMGFTHEAVVARLGEIPVYKRQFETIFGELTIHRVGQAIAAFERVLVTAPSPYDFNEQLRAFAGLDADDIAEDATLAAKYAEAKESAAQSPMSEEAKRGREIFFSEKGNCTACHVGANLADEKYHNIGIGMNTPEPDMGRFTISKDPRDTGAFKTPTIRNVALTAPYMHDGSVPTLEKVVEWYDQGGHPNSHLSEKIRPLKLSSQEQAELVEFMKACTGPTPSVEVSRLPAND